MQAFEEIKEYYKDITVNNLDLIREQKAELAELRRREAAAVKQLAVVTSENRRLTEPLEMVHVFPAVLRTRMRSPSNQESSTEWRQAIWHYSNRDGVKWVCF